MRNVRYDFSSVHVDIPSPIAEGIIDWGKTHITDDQIFVSHKECASGREDEMHATILYGIHDETPGRVIDVLKDTKKIHLKLKKLEVFTNPLKFDVVVLEVESEDLCFLNSQLKRRVPFTNKYESYRPHVTVAYVKKGKGWQHRGLSRWEGTEFTCDYAVFSSKNGIKQKIWF